MAEIILAKRMASTQESATLAMNARATRLAAEGTTIYNLTAGELAAETPQHIQAAVSRTLHLNKYTHVAGLPELRQQIAQEARSFYGLDWIEPQNVVVTAGAKPALYVSLLTLIDPGDEVIVPVPAWVSYTELITLTGGIIKAVPLTNTFDIDPKAIRAVLTPRTKAIILNSPHNPTGAVFSETALKELATALQGSHVTVIADDIYAKLIYDEHFTSVPSVGFEQLVIINGFSKSQALTGWRIGYLIADTPVAQAAATLLSNIMGNAAVPSQHAALAALALGDKPPKETITTLHHQRHMVDEALNDLPGLAYQLPGGAFYFFLDVRKLTKDSAAWCEQLLTETGVALVPGEAFATPGFARLSFVSAEQTLAKALEQIRIFVKKGGLS